MLEKEPKVEEYDSLFEWKKATGDWHYNPQMATVDHSYVGRILGNWKQALTSFSFKANEKEVVARPSEEWNSWGTSSSQFFLKSKRDTLSWGYHEGNSVLFQSTSELPTFCQEMAQTSGLEHALPCLQRQDPGNVLPWHFDTHSRFVKTHSCDPAQVVRYLVFLEDWHWGHFFQVGNNVISGWRAGDIYSWPAQLYHLSCNAGIVPKWTLTLTGLENPSSLRYRSEKEFPLASCHEV